MRFRINVVLGAFLMLVMAFGIPAGVSAQDETGTCQYSVSGSGQPNLAATGEGLTQEECRAILEDEFGAPLGTAPGVACQVILDDGERVLVQGDCSPDAVPAPTATTAPAPTATTAPAPTATTAPAPVTPEEPEAPEAPEVEEPEAPAAPVEELPATGAGTQDSAVDGSSMLILGSVAVVLAGGAFAIRRRSI